MFKYGISKMELRTKIKLYAIVISKINAVVENNRCLNISSSKSTTDISQDKNTQFNLEEQNKI
ncbi:hypothetical protein WN48_03572 [Eufriesea mexicana]|nr:hypothetical protein WN48_03572 [Eufriesea mexicana]